MESNGELVLSTCVSVDSFRTGVGCNAIDFGKEYGVVGTQVGEEG